MAHSRGQDKRPYTGENMSEEEISETKNWKAIVDAVNQYGPNDQELAIYLDKHDKYQVSRIQQLL